MQLREGPLLQLDVFERLAGHEPLVGRMVGHEPDGRDLALSDAAQTRPGVTRQAVGHGGGGRFGIIAFRPDQRHAILAVERHSAVAEEPDEQQQYARCKDYAAEKHQRRFQVFIPRRCGQQTVYDQQYDARKRQTKGNDYRFASYLPQGRPG